MTCRNWFQGVYREWGLERLLTWDLPLPLDPQVVRQHTGRVPPDRRTGVTVFLPWYVLKGTQLDVSELVRRTRIEEAPARLAGWFHPPVKKRTRLVGEISLRHKFWLYRTHVLVLGQRYRAQLAGNLEDVELALAGILGVSPDLVRKLRQSLARELKRAAGA